MEKKNAVVRKHTTITVPTPLFKKMKDRIKNTGFGSVSDYATFLLRETMVKIEEEEAHRNKKSDDSVIRKLRALGYVN